MNGPAAVGVARFCIVSAIKRKHRPCAPRRIRADGPRQLSVSAGGGGRRVDIYWFDHNIYMYDLRSRMYVFFGTNINVYAG